MAELGMKRRRAVLTDEKNMLHNRIVRPGSRQRITVSAPMDISAGFYSRTVVGTVGAELNVDALRRPKERKPLEAAEIVSAQGVQLFWARGILVLIAAVLIFIAGIQVYGLNTVSHRMAAVQRDIVRTQEHNEVLQEELAEAEKSINVGYEAVRYGMISAKAVESIKIKLPVQE